jgi:hypothetical protein
VTQPIRQGASEYWVNERADSNGAENYDDYPPPAPSYEEPGQAFQAAADEPLPQTDSYYQGGQNDQEMGAQNAAPVNGGSGQQERGYENGYQEGGGWHSVPQESEPEWEAAPTGWGEMGGEESQATEKIGASVGTGGYANGGSYEASHGSYQAHPDNEKPIENCRQGGKHAGYLAQGGAASQYSSWGGEEKQATGWGEEDGAQHNGPRHAASYGQEQGFEGAQAAKGPGFEGFDREHRTWQQSDTYSHGSASGSSVSGGGSKRPCRFFQRGICRFGQRCKDSHAAPNGPSRTAAPADRGSAYHATPQKDGATGWGTDAVPEVNQGPGFGGLQKQGREASEARKGPTYASGDARKPGIYESEGEKPAMPHTGGLNNSGAGRRGYAAPQWQPRGAPPRRSPM